MFGKRKEKDHKDSKLSGPRDIPEPIIKYLASTEIVDPTIVPFLKAVIKNSEKGKSIYDIYIFDPSDAESRDIKVHNYDTLKDNPDMIIAEGWLDEAAKKAELLPKKAISKIKFFTYDEILKQIEGLTDPESSVFFYTNAGRAAGGPLGRGAALIRLNAPVEGKKTKKYSIYSIAVIDMQPVYKEGQGKVYDENRADQIAKWVAESHKPRFC